MQLSRRCSGVRGLFFISMGGKKYDLLTTLLGILAGGICGGGKGGYDFFLFYARRFIPRVFLNAHWEKIK